MAYYAIVEVTETFNSGRTFHKQYKYRVLVNAEDLQDLKRIEDTFSSKEDPYSNLPCCEALVINVFKIPK